MAKHLFKWEAAGAAFIFLVGIPLHFAFQLSGQSRVVGLFVPVNESVWEHFKMAFWPLCLYSAVEYQFLRQQFGNLLPAKAMAAYFIPVLIGLAFYTYTAYIGREILAVDILIFLAAIAMGQWLSYRVMTENALPGYANIVSLASIVLLAVFFVAFTIYPPHLPIFRDSAGFYGFPAP